MRTWKSLSTTLVTAGAYALLATACGDDSTGDDDDTIDAAIDATPIDAEVDATPATYSGTITMLEVSILGVTQVGQGMQVAASFFEDGTTPAPVYEESPGSILGCKVYEYTPAQATAVGLDQGPLTLTIDNDTGTDGIQGPAIPACVFVPTRGYMCPDDPTCLSAPGDGCVGGTLKGVPAGGGGDVCTAGVLQIEDLDAPFTFGVGDGRYVSFVGSGTALLPDGTVLPVIGKISDSAIVVSYPAATTDCPGTNNAGIPLAETALHLTLGGVGPAPVCGTGLGCADPGMMFDEADVDMTLTSGGEGNVPTFSNSVNPGNDFTLTAAGTAVFGDLPLTGAAFTIGCDASTGCTTTPPSGEGVILSISTTDASVAGLSPLSMPPPTTKRVTIRCSVLGGTAVTVPADAAAYLLQSNTGATRIQSTFIRGDLAGGGDGITSNVNVVTGHAITTFKTITPP